MTKDGQKSNGSGPSIAEDALRAPLPKRFYKAVAVEPRDGGFGIALDGRPIRTPAKRALVVPIAPLAEAIAAEWEAQGAHIDPATMPLTRLVNTALDGVTAERTRVLDDIVAFAGSDLLCYRAEAPLALVRRQQEAWDPVLAWAQRDLKADLACRGGLMPVVQPAAALDAIAAALADLDALALAAVHVMTTLSGSAVLAVAHLRGVLSAEEAWAAATVDERWQTEQWGRDAEAEARMALRRAEFTAASRCLRLLRSR